MTRRLCQAAPFVLSCLLFACPVLAQQAAPHRPPAVPLFANDPFFSVWSMSDKLTDTVTKHWTEAPQPMTGLARIDGHVYRWMGPGTRRRAISADDAMQQVSLEVTPLHSRYRFAAAGIELRVSFFTPLLPGDLDVLSRPVSYLTWQAVATDGKQHDVQLLLDVDPVIAVNDASEQVTWSRNHTHGLTVLSVGSRDQNYLNRSGDRVRADWGYFHLAVPDGNMASTELSSDALHQFVTNGHLDDADELSMPKPAGSSSGSAAHLAVEIPLGSVGTQPVTRHIIAAYTETFAIEYLGRRLREYWQRNGMTESDMLGLAETQLPSLEAKADAFDQQETAAMRRLGGDDYAYLTSLVFRQTIAAHKLVADVDGTPMLFSKENDSNGCIDTVDVTYPSSPFFLLFNPTLLEAQLEPLMRYAAMDRWKFPFAPHDLGTYPLANGQVYGGGEKDEENQMPVEESGNLLIMIDALGRAQGSYAFAKKYMPQLTRWADFLAAKGLDPDNQLSTDDFAGHLAHNTNLSIKAIEALGAFVQIARGVGDNDLAAKFQHIVQPMPAQWQKMADDGDHFRLAFDQPNTWSQKYNLVWDDLLDLHLFPASVAKKDWAFYSTKLQIYGLPLDERKNFTKLDWEVWTATLGDQAQSADLIHRLIVWADATTSRVPTTDWYNTDDGKQRGFQARSVVGGIFIKALADPAIVKEFRTR
ncbi:protein of unknown function [Bryocella elongata]|uniref:L-glutaminase n=1 Tax=Bryocella elongata TaxID=863522 RepID=A0A1H6C211_9BACT|nr:glutaminase family protein [Bryocella elongata]SEG67050.1 protein of unknown function [Bryocella elongata]